MIYEFHPRWNSLKKALAIKYPLPVTAFLGSPLSSEGFWVMDIALVCSKDGKLDEFYTVCIWSEGGKFPSVTRHKPCVVSKVLE